MINGTRRGPLAPPATSDPSARIKQIIQAARGGTIPPTQARRLLLQLGLKQGQVDTFVDGLAVASTPPPTRVLPPPPNPNQQVENAIMTVLQQQAAGPLLPTERKF